MAAPAVTRPRFPKGYVDTPRGVLPWKRVERELAQATHYWLCSVRPNHRPHAVPKWAVWVKGRLYFDGSPETRHARNIAENPSVTVHLESGEKAVIMDGTAREEKPSRALAAAVARAYRKKYAALGYSPKPDTWDAGGLFEIVPASIIAWSAFSVDPTKFVFTAPSGAERRRR